MEETKSVIVRDDALDFFKGVTVIGIIFIHTVWWSGQSYVPNCIAQFSLLLDVPLFFFLSGASAVFSFERKNPFSGILRMVGMFSLFFLLYALFYQPENTFEFLIRSFFVQFPWAPKVEVLSSSTWFIPVLVLVYFTGFLVVRSCGHRNALLAMMVVLFVLVFKYENFNFLNSIELLQKTPDYLFTDLFFFLFGYFFYRHLRRHKYVKPLAIVIFLISVILTFTFFWDKPFDLQFYKFPHRIQYLIASMVSISLVMFFYTSIKKTVIFGYFGKEALPFYLAQCLSSGLMYFVVPMINAHWTIKLGVVFVCNILCSLVLAWIISRAYGLAISLLDRCVNRFDEWGWKE
jgi:hypothetical protein